MMRNEAVCAAAFVITCMLVCSAPASAEDITVWNDKPVRGADKVANQAKDEGSERASEEANETLGIKVELPWQEVDDLTHKCGDTFIVTSSHNKSTKCPFACPYYVQNKQDLMACSFACVKGDDCLKWNPNTGIPDKEMGNCRGPMVPHCREFPDGATTDVCKVCQSWYYLEQDGHCYPNFVVPISIGAILLLLVVGAVGGWIFDMARRPWTNADGLKSAMLFRENSKIHQPKEVGHRMHLWPLTTNLCKTLVAGPGMCLHFNFQAVFIVWPFLVALGWSFMALTIDNDLFVLGTRSFGTPRENCHLISWGYETQQRLMWTKVSFCYWVYVLTFICFLIHSVRQLRCFQSVDYENKTMKDFAAFVEGLPEQKGDSCAEEDLKAALEEATGQQLVGVSICWDFHESEDLVQKSLARELRHHDGIYTPSATPPQDAFQDDSEDSSFRKRLVDFELSIFHEEDERSDQDAEQEIVAALKAMTSSTTAVAVFKTEGERDEAVERAADGGGISFQGGMLQLEAAHCEPDTVYWQNFGDTSFLLQLVRLMQGFGCILLALLTWTVVFYVPYAWSVYSFNYANGQQPGPAYSITFTMVVVIGNAIMYEVCARVSDFVGYKFRDSRETTYMILYTIACTFNVLLDFVMTYITAYKIIKGLEFRTYFGIPIEHVSSFTDRFESYAMQRLLADNAFGYLFPSTCLIPFLLEPIITIYVPLKLGAIIVRCHPEIKGQEADGWLLGPAMEMGRYADIILNLILACVIFFFPGGFTHSLFFGMAFSHVYIYYFDHYRVLRSVPACTFANMDVDWWSQVMLIPVCGMILMCCIFKANKQGYGYYMEGNSIVLLSVAGFVVHCVVHFLLLVYVVPLFGKKAEPNPELDDKTYEETNQTLAVSWFSMNPIHCLRSQKIYMHSPPCMYLFMGKEHVLDVNKSIGCYFCDNDGTTPRTDDDNADWNEVSAAAGEAVRRVSQRMSIRWNASPEEQA
jgi:hypothetical protein